MRGSVVLAGAILGAVSLVGAPAHAGAAAPDPYSGSIETDCSISVPAVVEPGKRVVIRVSVDANSQTTPTGDIAVTITERPSGDAVWDRTVNYNGGTKRIVGPVLDKDRSYAATARFFPSDNTFARCRASEAFAVDTLDDNNPPDDNGPGGLLPDTGGPAMLWLLVGVGLLGGGAATVVYARRRTSPATA
ncbi:LPXTG cell wall anchor domain-containing protein [Nocardioides sp. HM23]|uniref:LPXTG cell wall anchor domain-containing protein n=1 Tax=Nocardioides bizhenqiangii TaxID=3095076 RepID=UPI002ACAB06E|nr:LPXTG cell wall anchor domain-containing protein [Nocardioides sp. HM23]MDZ5621662.1 LPXTG cell wall anchor domain-containing protein [Nocardioides sp. HM23]